MITVRNDTPPAELTNGVAKVFAVLQLENETGGNADLAIPRTSALALHKTLAELPILLAQKKADTISETGVELAEGDHFAIEGAVAMPGFPPLAILFCADHGLAMQMMRVNNDTLEASADNLSEVSFMMIEVAFGKVEVDEVAEFLDNLKAAAEKAED